MGLGGNLLRAYELGIFGKSPHEKLLAQQNEMLLTRDRERQAAELARLRETTRLEQEQAGHLAAQQQREQERQLAELAGSYDIFTQSGEVSNPLGLADTGVGALDFSSIPSPLNNQAFDTRRGRAIADIYGNIPLSGIPGVEAAGAAAAASRSSTARGEDLARTTFPAQKSVATARAGVEEEFARGPQYKNAAQDAMLGELLKQSIVSTLAPGQTAFGASGERFSGMVPTEESTIVGGIVDPATGMRIGGNPVTTRGYSPATRTPSLRVSPEDAAQLPPVRPTPSASGGMPVAPTIPVGEGMTIDGITSPAAESSLPLPMFQPSSNSTDDNILKQIQAITSGVKSNRFDTIPRQQLQMGPQDNIELQILRQKLSKPYLLLPDERRQIEERIRQLEAQSQSIPRP